MAFVLEVAAGGLGLLLFFVGLVWYYAVLEAILTPRPCEPACVAIQHGNQR
ncbi:MAG: hypothetical protein ABI640_13120 [Gammaproteobacteria bacterium]